MKRNRGIASDRTKLWVSGLTIAMGFVLIVTSVLKGTQGSPNYDTIQYFEQANPVHEVSVDAGTAWEQLGLPSSLRAVFTFVLNEVMGEAAGESIADENAGDEFPADDITDEAAGNEPAVEVGFEQTEPPVGSDGSYEYLQYGYAAPEDKDELLESGRPVIYIFYNEDGSEAYRVHGTYNGGDEGFFACDEDGNITGIVRDIPVTWQGVYDGNRPGTYTLTARAGKLNYSGEMPTAVITVRQPERAQSDVGIMPAALAGAGTTTNPYIIASAADLAFLAERVNAGDANYTAVLKEFKLNNDIDLSAYGAQFSHSEGKGWIPIGNSSSVSNTFKGVFDGNNKKITGLYISKTTNYSALFGYFYGATVKNLGLVGVDINGQVSTAGIVASMANKATIENCYVTGSITGYQAVGGIVGVINSTGTGTNTISQCYTTCSVTAMNFRAGGIAGNVIGPANISNCYSRGNITNTVSATGTTQAGGILGDFASASGFSVSVTNCYSTGVITVNDTSGIAGGITGGTGSTGAYSVSNCAALNTKIGGGAASKRVKGGTYAVAFTNNRAYDKMQDKNGNTTWSPTGTKTNENGLNVTADTALTANFWTNEMGWNGSTIWQFENGKLPVLRNIPGQTGAPHFDGGGGTDPPDPPDPPGPGIDPTDPLTIIGTKAIKGNAVTDKDKLFTFRLTQVNANGEPVFPAYQQTTSRNGQGGFSFKLPNLPQGTYYYKVTEDGAGTFDGNWNYEDREFTVVITVDSSGKATQKLIGGVPGNGGITQGKPGVSYWSAPASVTASSAHAPANSIYPSGSPRRFNIGGGYVVYASDFHNTVFQASYYTMNRLESRNNRGSALCYALASPDYGMRLTLDEFNAMLGVSVPDNGHRADLMLFAVWLYEASYLKDYTLVYKDVWFDSGYWPLDLPIRPGSNTLKRFQQDLYSAVTGGTANGRKYYDALQTLMPYVWNMMKQYDNINAGTAVSSLHLTYTPTGANMGTLSFKHSGYQPPDHNLSLSWTATAGMTVKKNGTAMAPGSTEANTIKRTDTITVEYIGAPPDVNFKLTDSVHYLKGGSIKGDLYGLDNKNGTDSRALIGHAESLLLSSTLNLAGGDTGSSYIIFTNNYSNVPVKAWATINGNKTTSGDTPLPAKEFVFRLTKVNQNGQPLSPSFVMTATRTGAGTFSFKVPFYEGDQGKTHYYLITEVAGARDGWTYDSAKHIVEVRVAANWAVTTSLDGGPIGTTVRVIFGTPTIIHVKPNPVKIWDITTNKKYIFTGHGYENFILTEGSKKYFGFCGDDNLAEPSSNRDIYQLQSSGGKNGTSVALAAALGVASGTAYQNTTGLTEAEYASLFGLSSTPQYSRRREDMQDLVWWYENGSKLNSSQRHLSDEIGKMLAAYENTPAGQSITTLSLGYNENTGRMTFAHVGYQPVKYNTILTWTGDTTGLSVKVNGMAVSSGIPVTKTSNIEILYTGEGTVNIILTDYQLYLKGGSLKGAMLKNISNGRTQPCMVGYAEFVNIQNSFSITRSTNTKPPTSIGFANVYKKLPTVWVELNGDKEITGIASTNEEFIFYLTQVTDAGGTSASYPLYTDIKKVTGSGTFKFRIEGLYPGTYYFRIAEHAENPAEGWTYDTVPRVIRVDVSEAPTPVVTVTYPEGGNKVTFRNSYVRPGGASIDLEGGKRVTGADAPDQIFGFSLIQVDDATGAPYTQGEPHMDSAITEGAGTFHFELNNLFPGTYYYKITELAGEAGDGWNYDGNVYIAVVTVSNDGSGNKASVSYHKIGSGAGDVIFTNAFSPPPKADAVIRGDKVISGVASTYPDFIFILQQVTDETGTSLFLPAYSDSVTVTGAGGFRFTVPDLLPGTYYFRIMEDASQPADGWKYDQKAYVVTVAVTDDETPIVTVSYPDGKDSVRFTNRFSSQGIMPETGGPGRRAYAYAGAVLVLAGAAGIALFLPKTCQLRCSGKRNKNSKIQL